ncbi:hypothetical protein CI102_13048 [Trichoderma harzianum]|uniref:Uncharacterized protein n=1 Tax=Trichoderma harzianum CBS 226.95 TaxID=983964 RepID=A0A2T3ZTK3_TRIHA|nr:hypothetical protein M431DRAFT_332101 [Trichoderma harzianum CBS 226.95]PKK43783.1 hypothetical protein CI102_13048 [Trichoderma harzianum]PTB48123.1 hypothetical protein M431DRAFT_332101 [Trichoderma harzianum CBS 226.95]
MARFISVNYIYASSIYLYSIFHKHTRQHHLSLGCQTRHNLQPHPKPAKIPSFTSKIQPHTNSTKHPNHIHVIRLISTTSAFPLSYPHYTNHFTSTNPFPSPFRH